MEKRALLAAIKNSGGADQPDADVDAFLAKLECLEKTIRYRRLLASIVNANDKSNFLAAVFETTFAFQFESAGLALDYEVKQNDADGSTIDFLRLMASGKSVFFEARLLQQDASTATSMKEQLEDSCFYRVAVNGQDEHDAIVRLQNVILSKVQKRDGTPTKFLHVAANVINIVVVDVSDLILGTIDVHDCLLATHGDPAVAEEYRRGIFGLFQDSDLGYPTQIQALAKSFEHIQNTLSGVLFSFKASKSSVLDYSLQQYMMWNPRLVDKALAKDVLVEVVRALPERRDRGSGQ
jgi:hypothetical protein